MVFSNWPRSNHLENTSHDERYLQQAISTREPLYIEASDSPLSDRLYGHLMHTFYTPSSSSSE